MCAVSVCVCVYCFASRTIYISFRHITISVNTIQLIDDVIICDTVIHLNYTQFVWPISAASILIGDIRRWRGFSIWLRQALSEFHSLHIFFSIPTPCIWPFLWLRYGRLTEWPVGGAAVAVSRIVWHIAICLTKLIFMHWSKENCLEFFHSYVQIEWEMLFHVLISIASHSHRNNGNIRTFAFATSNDTSTDAARMLRFGQLHAGVYHCFPHTNTAATSHSYTHKQALAHMPNRSQIYSYYWPNWNRTL